MESKRLGAIIYSKGDIIASDCKFQHVGCNIHKKKKIDNNSFSLVFLLVTDTSSGILVATKNIEVRDSKFNNLQTLQGVINADENVYLNDCNIFFSIK